LEKFREIIGKIDAYLSDNAAKPNGLDIILTGDFNFPANIVEWIPTDNGLNTFTAEGKYKFLHQCGYVYSRQIK